MKSVKTEIEFLEKLIGGDVTIKTSLLNDKTIICITHNNESYIWTPKYEESDSHILHEMANQIYKTGGLYCAFNVLKVKVDYNDYNAEFLKGWKASLGVYEYEV